MISKNIHFVKYYKRLNILSLLLVLISTIIIVFLSWDHKVSRLEGSFLLLCMLGYLWLNFLKNAFQSEMQINVVPVHKGPKTPNILDYSGGWAKSTVNY